MDNYRCDSSCHTHFGLNTWRLDVVLPQEDIQEAGLVVSDGVTWGPGREAVLMQTGPCATQQAHSSSTCEGRVGDSVPPEGNGRNR